MASILTTTAQVKTRLGIPSAITQHDAAIDYEVNRVDGWLAGRFGISALTVTSYTETLDVDRGDVYLVRLERRPVKAVQSIKDDGDALAAADFRIHSDEGYVSMTEDGSFFTVGRGTVEVTYTAGFLTTDAIWPDLERAATDYCAAQFNQGSNLGISETSIGRRRVKLSDTLPESVRAILGRFERVF